MTSACTCRRVLFRLVGRSQACGDKGRRTILQARSGMQARLRVTLLLLLHAVRARTASVPQVDMVYWQQVLCGFVMGDIEERTRFQDATTVEWSVENNVDRVRSCALAL